MRTFFTKHCQKRKQERHMNDILDTKVFLRTKIGPGAAGGARAILYADHIEIKNRKGDLILKANLDQLRHAKSQQRLIQFTVNDKYFLLIFSSGRTVLFGFMGALGKILGMTLDSTPATAQTWVDAMKQHGVHFTK